MDTIRLYCASNTRSPPNTIIIPPVSTEESFYWNKYAYGTCIRQLVPLFYVDAGFNGTSQGLLSSVAYFPPHSILAPQLTDEIER